MCKHPPLKIRGLDMGRKKKKKKGKRNQRPRLTGSRRQGRNPISRRHQATLPLSAFSLSNSSSGGFWRYPCGLFLVHRHRSSHASSNVFSALHRSSRFARSGFAVRSNTSPARLPTTSYGSSLPTAFSNALIISNTVLPLPVPRFQARVPGWCWRK